MAEVIDLSSDDENRDEPPTKKTKYFSDEEQEEEDIICINSGQELSDEDIPDDNLATDNAVDIKDGENELPVDPLKLPVSPNHEADQIEGSNNIANGCADKSESPKSFNGIDKSDVEDTNCVTIIDSDNDEDVDGLLLNEEVKEESANGVEEANVPDEKLLSSNTSLRSFSNDGESVNDVDIIPELNTFLEVCKEQIGNAKKYEKVFDKIPDFLKLYKTFRTNSEASDHFQKYIAKKTTLAGKSAASAVVQFKEVYQHFKCVIETEAVEVSEKEVQQLSKLEFFMKKILKKLKKLEEAEVDFDASDDSDSPYIQRDRYAKRLSQIYAKYCKILKRNPNKGRPTYEKLAFAASSYPEINAAISRKYKNSTKFPSYYEFNKFIAKVVKDQNLKLSEAETNYESSQYFTKLGELLQVRRKRELYENHSLYVVAEEDPARSDGALDQVLKENYKEGKVKIENLCDEYVKKQELAKDENNKADSESNSQSESDSEKDDESSSSDKE